MPPQSIKASKAGIEKAEMARIDKGWSRKDIADRVVTGEGKSELKGISLPTVKTFFRCNGVTTQNFVGICKALGLDWQEIKESNTVYLVEVDNSNYNNPFIPQHGKIDNPRFLFGREREMRRVFDTLNAGSSVAIIGERAIGKSSLLQAIYRQAPTELRHPRQPIYIDLQIVGDEDDFYVDLCHKAGIEKAKGSNLLRALESNPLLLLLDEVENMKWDGFTNPTRSLLRGLTEGFNPPLRLVVAAETSLDILFPGKNMTSPFKGHEENLKQWDDQISRKFIISRLQADWLTPVDKPVSFTEAEIAELIAKSGGYPQKLMTLCYQTYDRYIN